MSKTKYRNVFYNCLIGIVISLFCYDVAIAYNNCTSQTKSISTQTINHVQEQVDNYVGMLKNTIGILCENESLSNNDQSLENKLDLFEPLSSVYQIKLYGISDNQGNFLDSLGNKIDVSNQNFYRSGMIGETYIGGVKSEDSAIEEFELTMSAPYYVDNAYAGVLAIIIDLKDLQSIMDQVTYGNNGYIILIDRENNFMSSSNLKIDKNELKDTITQTRIQLLNGEIENELLKIEYRTKGFYDFNLWQINYVTHKNLQNGNWKMIYFVSINHIVSNLMGGLLLHLFLSIMFIYFIIKYKRNNFWMRDKILDIITTNVDNVFIIININDKKQYYIRQRTEKF